MSLLNRFHLAAFAYIALASSAAFALHPYTISNLGVSGRAANSGGLNDGGHVAFWVFAEDVEGGAELPQQAFFFKGDTSLALPSLGGSLTFVSDINDRGVIVGGASDPLLNRVRAVRYINGAIEDIKVPALNGSTALALNDSGQIVGSAFLNSGSRAFLWNAVGRVQNLGTLGGANSSATDINNQGVVVGWSELAPPMQYHSQAFIYQNGSMTPLNIFGAQSSAANAINDSGAIVGTFAFGGAADPEVHAFLYDPVQGSVDLGVPGLNSQAYDINELGVIVGRSERIPDSSDYRAFVYDPVHGMRFLEDLIPPGLGWDKLVSARSINNRGQILGEGVIGGELRVFLITPVPEPQSGVLLFSALLASAYRRPRRPNAACTQVM